MASCVCVCVCVLELHTCACLSSAYSTVSSGQASSCSNGQRSGNWPAVVAQLDYPGILRLGHDTPPAPKAGRTAPLARSFFREAGFDWWALLRSLLILAVSALRGGGHDLRFSSLLPAIRPEHPPA